MGPRGLPGSVGPVGVGEQGPQGQRGAVGKQGRTSYEVFETSPFYYYNINYIYIIFKQSELFTS